MFSFIQISSRSFEYRDTMKPRSGANDRIIESALIVIVRIFSITMQIETLQEDAAVRPSAGP